MSRLHERQEGTCHVEGYHILERDQASLVLLHERLVDTKGTGAGRETKDKGTSWSRREGGDAVDDVVGHVGAGSFSIVADDEPHVANWVMLEW